MRYTRILLLVVLTMAAATPFALAQAPRITSISDVGALQYQTITINGSYFFDRFDIVFKDLSAGRQASPGGSPQGLIVNSWTDSQVVLGGFTSDDPEFLPKVGDEFSITISWTICFHYPCHTFTATKDGTVVYLETTTDLTSSPNPSTDGEEVTFTATVSATSATPPDGETVSFMEGSTLLGTGTLSGGQATFSTSALPAGTNSVSAQYNGDSALKKSRSKAVKQVVQAGQ